VLSACSEKSLETVDYDAFAGSKAKRFRSALSNESRDALFAAFCHGNRDALVVGRAWVVRRDDGAKFRGKMCVMVACCSLEGLGRAMVAAGALGAVGFRNEVRVWTAEPARMATLGDCFAGAYVAWMLRPGAAKAFADSIRSQLQDAIDRTSKMVQVGRQVNPIERWKDLLFIGLLRDIKETIDYVH
jgi:hypothetical protein